MICKGNYFLEKNIYRRNRPSPKACFRTLVIVSEQSQRPSVVIFGMGGLFSKENLPLKGFLLSMIRKGSCHKNPYKQESIPLRGPTHPIKGSYVSYPF